MNICGALETLGSNIENNILIICNIDHFGNPFVCYLDSSWYFFTRMVMAVGLVVTGNGHLNITMTTLYTYCEF